jgi:putative transposase
MVRAAVVRHPIFWAWCGYRELTGQRERYRLLHVDRLSELLGLSDRKSLAEKHRQRIAEAIEAGRLAREGIWTESIAVGTRAFVETIASGNRKRKKLKIASTEEGVWYVKEDRGVYGKQDR